MRSLDLSVLIIAAMKQEIRLLLHRKVSGFRAAPELRNLFVSVENGNRAGILVCGVGRKKALKSLRQCLACCSPSSVLITGWSGALSRAVNLHDLVIVESVHHRRKPDSPPLPFHPGLKRLLEETCVRSGVAFSTGIAVCSDSVVSTAKTKAALAAGFHGDLVDMESYYLLELLTGRGIPAAMVRAISDTADEKIGLDFDRLPGTKIRKAWYFTRHPCRGIAYARLLWNLSRSASKLGKTIPVLLSAMLAMESTGKRLPEPR